MRFGVWDKEQLEILAFCDDGLLSSDVMAV